MRILTVIRILAAACTLTVAGLTATLAYHVRVKPVGGPFTRLLPQPGSLDPYGKAVEFARSLEEREIPDIEPGEHAYQKACEMMAMGRLDEARDKLTTIFNIFPNSSVAQEARRIVGTMNLDAILGSRDGHGRSTYKVRPGDSYLAIVARQQTSIDMLVHLNSMQRLKGIQPGDELLVMPLNYRLQIEARRQAVSVWDGGRFICEFTALSMNGVPGQAASTTISQKIAELNGGRIPAHSEQYPASQKVLLLAKPAVQIRGWDPAASTGDPPQGILLKPHEMEELALLVRPGNTVEFR